MATSTPALGKNPTVINAVSDKSQSLQIFNLLDLAQYTPEKSYSSSASKDFHLFYVGRDDVHDVLKHVLSRVTVSLYLNMFGYDDDELNDIVMAKVMDPHITVLITLDQSQAGGKHEQMLIAADKSKNLSDFNSHYVIGQSGTHQISHTKGFVADGRVGGEGSTNWSVSGEGTFVNGTFYVSGRPQGSGYKAQNNTQSIFTDSDTINRFQAELILEHIVAQKQSAANQTAAKPAQVAVPANTPQVPVPANTPPAKTSPVKKRAATAKK